MKISQKYYDYRSAALRLSKDQSLEKNFYINAKRPKKDDEEEVLHPLSLFCA